MTENKSTSRHLLPQWLNGPWGNVVVVAAIYILVYMAWLYFHWGGEDNVILIGDLIYLPIYVMTSVVMLRTATVLNSICANGVHGGCLGWRISCIWQATSPGLILKMC